MRGGIPEKANRESKDADTAFKRRGYNLDLPEVSEREN